MAAEILASREPLGTCTWRVMVHHMSLLVEGSLFLQHSSQGGKGNLPVSQPAEKGPRLNPCPLQQSLEEDLGAGSGCVTGCVI